MKNELYEFAQGIRKGTSIGEAGLQFIINHGYMTPEVLERLLITNRGREKLTSLLKAANAFNKNPRKVNKNLFVGLVGEAKDFLNDTEAT